MSLEIKTLDLSFCSDAAHNVVNPEAKQYIMNRLKEKHNINMNKKHAFILNQKSVYFLEKTQHIISIKSSGTNYYLYLTNINNINYCFYIDRKIKSGYTYPRIISVKYSFSDEIFEDTLLDGELVRDQDDNDSWIFLITDLLVLKGKKLDCNIVNRFNLLYEMLTNSYNKNHDLDICPLIVKKLFLYKDYDELITRFIPSLPYKTNGLYFNSLNTKHANQLFLFKTGNNHHSKKSFVKKKQPVEEKKAAKEIVLKMVKTEKSDIYNLFCDNRNELHKLGMAHISNLRTSKMIRKLFQGEENILVNCKYNEKFNKYEPIGKAESNDITQLSSL